MKKFTGARDTGNFRQNIQSGQRVVKSSITYHGLFNEYYFSIGEPENEKLMTTHDTVAISKNPFTGNKEYFISVAMKSKYDGEGIKKIGRPPLNCAVVLDISGSMGSGFRGRSNQEEEKLSKLEVAKRTILGLTENFQKDDNFGVVIFDNDAEVLFPFQKWGQVDQEQLKKSINSLKPRGGTNMSEGIIEGARMIQKFLKESGTDPNEISDRENRILFLTDAQPTAGETKSTGLFSLAKEYSEQRIYCTFIGVGVDFNTQLLEVITKTKGAMYFSVHSASEFKRRMETEFDYMMMPICFDIKLQVDGSKIKRVYGSPDSEDKKDTTIADISTAMPSHMNEQNETQGGIIVLKMDPTVSDGLPLNLTLSFNDKKGNPLKEVDQVVFPSLNQDQDEFYQDSSIRKAILLIRYVKFIKNFERNEENKQKANKLIQLFKSEIPIIGDKKLQREVEILEEIIKF
ncbi:inter-alpha-trypsin inhibitor heavy chain family member [Anaeramoeba ignava]|uniref:Inter-alpha-trypsin inhibitor heavy chain family member n=1 Tax=Anaeramoeba ignava TaxID=1746090 RepID=A0A9Q0LKX6_ANAIG|nr:inter-alpha-trypsin inhibitor heavy chain family member [Anaeramoeba ignava]